MLRIIGNVSLERLLKRLSSKASSKSLVQSLLGYAKTIDTARFISSQIGISSFVEVWRIDADESSDNGAATGNIFVIAERLVHQNRVFSSMMDKSSQMEIT